MPKKFLQDVYSTSPDADVAGLYDRWAKSYDDEVGENAYATPSRLADALIHTGTPTEAHVLDYGCGTGLSGAALAARGYSLIDGTDISPEMLAEAEAKQIYGRLWLSEPDAPPALLSGSYDVFVAAGVISPGAGPARLLADLSAALQPGGRLAFSFNDHALEDAAYMDGLRRLPDQGMTAIFEEYGDHLPGIGLRSTIYVFEKA